MLRFVRSFMLVAVLWVPAGVVCGETVAGLPAPTGYVNDFAKVLTPQTVQNLENLCTQVDHQAHAQIAVVTIKSIDPDKSGATPSIEEFATALEDKWKVGPKGTDRGLLLIVSLNPRKYRIEVGYGLEGLLNDAKVGDIGRDMQPYLRTGDYNQGIALAVREISQDIAADAGVTLGTGQQVQRYHYTNEPQSQLNPIAVLIIGGVIVVVIAILIGTGHIGILFYLLFNLLGGGGRGGGGFGGGSSDGGGGFGGFGGGSSGGGGASGDY